jgi:hypothetical protein
MTAVSRRLPTLNLIFGEEIFPVKKVDLYENLGVFQEDDSVLGAEEYKVRSQVRLSVFRDFVCIIESGRITVSEENCVSLGFLSDEFRFEALSNACKAFIASRGQTLECSGNAELSFVESVGCERNVNPVRRVTLTIGTSSRTYTVLRSMKEARRFACDLPKANKRGIAIEGIDACERPVEKAVEVMYANTVAYFGDDDRNRPFFVSILWVIRRELGGAGINATIYCWNLLNEIAPTGFDKARFLLLSQCDLTSPDDFVPLTNANAVIVQEAIEMLRKEKNGETEKANALLLRLKAVGRYANQLGQWGKTEDLSYEYNESASD